MSFSIFLNFEGNCKEAVTFYAKVFKQKEPSFLTYGEIDTSFDPNVQISEKGKSLIADTSLNICGTSVQFSDMPDNFEFIRGNSVALTVSFDTFEEARSIFDLLSEKGTIFAPLLKETSEYSLLADQFNICWQVSAKK